MVITLLECRYRLYHRIIDKLTIYMIADHEILEYRKIRKLENLRADAFNMYLYWFPKIKNKLIDCLRAITNAQRLRCFNNDFIIKYNAAPTVEKTSRALFPSQGSIRSTRLQSDRRERARMLRPYLLSMREYEQGAFNLHKVESWLGEVNGERSLRIIRYASTYTLLAWRKLVSFIRSLVWKKKRANYCAYSSS